MPIFIPVVLIGVGIATGGAGVAFGGKGAYDMKKARDRLKRAGARYQDRRAEAVVTLQATNDKLAELGGQQKRALVDVVLRMGEFLRRHERQVRESERLLVDGVDATMTKVPGLPGLDVEAVAWLGGALGAAVAGAGTGAGVTAAAGSFGVASTGAAISGLSGAAASSATMAFLGGGSVAAGGGGMALGGAALNVVTIGPALLVGGFVVKGRGDKELTQAREFEVQISVAIADLDEQDVRLAAVDARADELGDTLRTLTTQAVAALDVLESEPFEPTAHAERFQRAMTLVMAVRDVAATPVVDADGQLSERSANLTVKYRPMTEDTHHA